MVVSATARSAATASDANRSAESARPAIRAAAGAGSVRTNTAQGVTLSIAAETPNWKNPTPRTANAAYEATSTSGCRPARGSPNSDEEQRREGEGRDD